MVFAGEEIGEALEIFFAFGAGVAVAVEEFEFVFGEFVVGGRNREKVCHL